ncbi:Transmembrane secretion effector [Microlunatus soli]|uniref:Transmembrane secretion effector n=1 Tax=Microlunatus soli TaxID=630515 RepID=A0A1H2AA54_9ACTN|nr:Transmembrane secretion effector [Microlunatus soli]
MPTIRRVRLLRTNPVFRSLWLANLAAALASSALGTVLTVQIFTITHSAAATSGLLVAATVPAIALGTIGGLAADRIRRDRLVKLTSWLRVPTVACLLLVGDHAGALYVIAFVQAAQLQFFVPAEQATVADIVSDKDLPDAMSANSVARNVTRLAGPALGGILITWIGFVPTIAAVSGCLGVAALLFSFLPRSEHVPSADVTIIRDWLDGPRITVTHVPARAVAVFQILDSIKEGPLSSLFPVLMLGTIGATAAYMGTVNSSFAVTAILAAPLVGIITRRLGYRWPIAGGAAISGGLLLLLAAVPNATTALAVFALSGFPFTISWVAANTWLLANTDATHRGRVTGTTSTLNAIATAVFAGIAGAAAEIVPVVTVIGVAALIQTLAGPCFLIMTRRYTGRVNQPTSNASTELP